MSIAKIVYSVVACALIGGYIYWEFFPKKIDRTEKEQQYIEQALVATVDQEWEDIGEEIIMRFNNESDYYLEEDANLWRVMQYFEGVPYKDHEDYKEWKQCVINKHTESRYCAHQRWGYDKKELQWTLLGYDVSHED